MSEKQKKRKMIEKREFSSEASESRLDEFSSSQQFPAAAQKKKRNKNKRRFSDEQVKSLERIFESETKLEPRKKVQVARELGLQARQVAIWFQNKRARWKSKEIEKKFRILKANFDHLKTRFESMKEEKESLLAQLQELNNVLHKTQDRSSSSKEYVASILEKDRARGDKVAGLVAKSRTQEELDLRGLIYSDDDNCGPTAPVVQEDPEQLNPEENVSGTLVSTGKWCSFDNGNFFDHPNDSSFWWDSWT